jgi:hypothetical protein
VADAQRIGAGPPPYRLEGDTLHPALSAITPDTLAERASREGAAAAELAHPWGWFGRGLLGGLVGGPIGTVVAYRKAGQGDVTPLLPSGLDPADQRDRLYLEGYLAGFGDRIRSRRKGYALIGGAIGTGVLTYVLLQVFDIGGKAGGSVISPPPDPPGY